MNQTDFITGEVLEKQIKTKVFGKKIFYKEEMDSTNTEAKRLAIRDESLEESLEESMEKSAEDSQDDFHGLLVITEQQTMGKGRRGRSWSSPKGTGIWMSLLLRPKISIERASMLTLTAALSVADSITEITGLEALIKWPNDIVVNGRKVCGILTEMSSEANEIRYVVIGIGINVNTEEFPEEIREIATSLLIEKRKLKLIEKKQLKDLAAKQTALTDRQQSSQYQSNENKSEIINRSVLVAGILEHLEHNYNKFLQSNDLEFLLTDYNKKLINLDKQVKIIGSSEEITGTAKGINKKGELLVQTENGLIEVCSGEVSVRGLYGYV